jgi:hypothetical protein
MKKVLAAIVGTVMMLVGIVLLILPGPGILLILAGAAVLWRAIRGTPKLSGSRDKFGSLESTERRPSTQDR